MAELHEKDSCPRCHEGQMLGTLKKVDGHPFFIRLNCPECNFSVDMHTPSPIGETVIKDAAVLTPEAVDAVSKEFAPPRCMLCTDSLTVTEQAEGTGLYCFECLARSKVLPQKVAVMHGVTLDGNGNNVHTHTPRIIDPVAAEMIGYMVTNPEYMRIFDAIEGNHGTDQKAIAVFVMETLVKMLKKNKDYNSSIFKPPLLVADVSAEKAIRVRLSDKIERFIALQTADPLNREEPIRDTAMDAAAYFMLWVIFGDIHMPGPLPS